MPKRDPAELQRQLRESVEPLHKLFEPPAFEPVEPVPRLDEDAIADAVAKAVAEAMANQPAEEKPQPAATGQKKRGRPSGRRNNATPQRDEQMAWLEEEGMKPADIARKYKVNHSTVTRAIKRYWKSLQNNSE